MGSSAGVLEQVGGWKGSSHAEEPSLFSWQAWLGPSFILGDPLFSGECYTPFCPLCARGGLGGFPEIGLLHPSQPLK